jgi:predicted TIM-barrel fold metal-dependent hydrolase
MLKIRTAKDLLRLSLSFQDVKEEARRRGASPRVDYHCHISMTEFADIEHPTVVSVTQEEFIADLDEAGFEKAVVLSDVRTTPEQVSSFVKQEPDRFIGFGYVNPLKPEADEDILRQRRDLGLFGLKLYPTTDGFIVDDPKAFKVYEAASGIGMPVMFHHAGMPSPGDLLKHSDPALIDVVACSFPDLKIVLAHLGYPRVDETLYVARKHRNVWCDISWPYGDVNHQSYAYMLWRDLLTALNLGVLNKMVFGTDYPGVRQRPYADMLMSVNRYATHEDLRIPEAKLQSILGENARPLLPSETELKTSGSIGKASNT